MAPLAPPGYAYELRYKLLNYVKNNCDDRFTMCHSYNGKIRIKDSAKCGGDTINDDKDEGNQKWLVILSPDDLFKLDVEIDFKALNYHPLFINQNVD